MARSGYVSATFMHGGKKYYVYGHSKEEAQRKAGKKLAMLEAGIKEYKSAMTVSKWADEWVESYKEGTVGDAWLNEIKGIIKNYIDPSIGKRMLCDVKPMDISKMYNSYSYLSDSHGKKIVQITRQIFNTAEENDLIGKSPARNVKAPKWTIKTGYRAITEEERALTIRTAMKYPGDGLFFLIMLYCGLRPQEVAALKMRDYDPSCKTIRVVSARKADGSIGAPKSRAGSRVVPVPDVLADILDGLPRKPDELVVTSAQGKPLTKTTQKRMWHRFCRKMDIENGAELFRNAVVKSTLADDLEPYCYRHTYCTDLQDAGVPVTVASRLMGHSSISVTANIYTHHSEGSFEDARKKINDLHDRQRGPEE